MVQDGHWATQSHERAPYSLTLASRRSIHAIFRSEASLARLSSRPRCRSMSVLITARNAHSVTIGRSKSRSTRERLTITSSNRSKLCSMPNSNSSRSSSKSDNLLTRPQSSQIPIHCTIQMLSIIAQAPLSHPSASNPLRRL